MSYWTEEKDPSDVDYWEVEVDAAWLGLATISTVDFNVPTESGLTKQNEGINTNIVRAQLSGGNVGTWGIEVTVTTSDGRTRQKTFYIVIREK